MMKRAWPAFAFSCAGLVALLHCGDVKEPSDEVGGGSTEGGTTSCTATRTCGSSGSSTSGSSGGTTSGGSSGQASSSGGGGGSSSSGSPVPTRIPTAVGLPTASAGCGSGNAPPQRGAYKQLASGRRYIPYQPFGYSSAGPGGGKGYPVMVALHGCYGDPEVFGSSAFMGFQDSVGNDGIVVYGAANNPTSGCTWDVGGQSDIDYLDSVIADVAAQFCIDQSRVLLLGFSWGAYMAQYYACNRPGTIKAIAGGAGGYPDWLGGSVDPAVCGQIHSLVYGRTADQDEQIYKSYNARDKRKAVSGCNGGDIGAPSIAPPSADGSYCTEATGCAGGLFTTFCEDKFDFTSVGGQSDYNHTIYKPWHRPMWDWFTNIP